MKEKFASKQNQNLMNLIKRVHSVVENGDVDKHRQTQDNVAAILANKKDTIIEAIQIKGMYGEWVRPDWVHGKKKVILYCHGGGYMTGSCLYARTLTTKLATSASIDVLCFDYRLAPENPYPAALEDAIAAWDCLMLLGYGAREVIVAGDSAGGNLALALTRRLKEEGRILPAGLVLMSPWTDMTASSRSYETKAELDPILDKEYLMEAAASYGKEMDLSDSGISPLFGGFEGFPPTYIQVGSNEILLEDSVRLHKKMVKEQVPAKIEVFKGMWHVFQMSPFKTAYDAMDKIAGFIYEVL